MEEKNGSRNWLAWGVPAALAVIAAAVPFADSVRSSLGGPVAVVLLLLPLAASLSGALYGWPATAALCAAAAAFGWKTQPLQALPLLLMWCAGWGAVSCIPMKRRTLRPALRTGLCLAAWCAALLTLHQWLGRDLIGGLAQAACDYVEQSSDSLEILMRAYSAGLVRLDTEALAPAMRYMGRIVISDSVRTQMLLTLRVSLEGMLPSLLCSAVVYHTALTVLLSTVLPDWQLRKRGEKGEFPPMEQWYMPRRMGAAVFALCFGWVIALMAGEGIGAYLGWMCADVFRIAFMIQGICWLQWMGKRMGVRSAARNIWSVALGLLAPLIPMIMGMIDQRRDARHLRPKEEADQE